jgi:hypothetical protein
MSLKPVLVPGHLPPYVVGLYLWCVNLLDKECNSSQVYLLIPIVDWSVSEWVGESECVYDCERLSVCVCVIMIYLSWLTQLKCNHKQTHHPLNTNTWQHYPHQTIPSTAILNQTNYATQTATYKTKHTFLQSAAATTHWHCTQAATQNTVSPINWHMAKNKKPQPNPAWVCSSSYNHEAQPNKAAQHANTVSVSMCLNAVFDSC